MTYIRIVAWDVVFSIVKKTLTFGATFFMTAWVGMLAWALVSRFTEFATISYIASLLGLLALWIVILPLIIVALKFYQPPERDLFS